MSRYLTFVVRVASLLVLLWCFNQITAALVSKTSQVVYAQTPRLDPLNARSFRPTMDAFGMINVERSVPLSHLKLNLSLMVDSESDSLTHRFSQKSHSTLMQVTSGQLSLAIGLWGRISLALGLPLHIIKTDLDGPNGLPPQSDDGVGDLSISLKGIIFNSAKGPVGLALLLHTYWGVAEPLVLLSDAKTPIIEPWLILDSEWRYAAIALNVGYRLRDSGIFSPASLENEVFSSVEDPIRFGPEVTYRAGVSVFYVPSFLHHCFEVIGGQPVGVEGGASRAQHLEVVSGLKLIFNRGSFLTIGGGRGLIDGYSQPAWRAFMGITFHPKPQDSDRDGIINELDDCPSQPEDIDGFQDRDGCPDSDNDQDGLPDLYDQCPNDPEDFNGFEDEDGCPDAERDSDRDGIIDRKDDCPNQPEDKDQYNDADGCPDPDNDQDGLEDRIDRCPNDPEDFDDFEDQDGCPDPDNDQDTVPDISDRCPNTPEDLDGDADQDGCPEQTSQTVTDQGSRLEIKGKVYFDLDRATIKPESYQLLMDIAKFLNQRPEISLVEVQGHTDLRGSRAHNLDLSDRRAAAVKSFLIKEGFVEAQRLQSKGYGPDQPLMEGDSATAHAKNRRVEFIVLQREE